MYGIAQGLLNRAISIKGASRERFHALHQFSVGMLEGAAHGSGCPTLEGGDRPRVNFVARAFGMLYRGSSQSRLQFLHRKAVPKDEMRHDIFGCPCTDCPRCVPLRG